MQQNEECGFGGETGFNSQHSENQFNDIENFINEMWSHI